MSGLLRAFRLSTRSQSVALLPLLLFLHGCLPAGRSTSGRALEIAEGDASYYADSFEGRATASGEPLRQSQMTAAHRSFPFGTTVRVINLANNREVIVRINDRGPAKQSRIIDLTRGAAEQIGMIASGIVRVRIEVLAWGSD